MPQPAFAVDHAGQFAERHAVHDRNRVHADERAMLRFEHRAVHIESVRIGTVQYDQLLAVRRAGFHQVVHRREIGVIAQADILDVEQQHVEPLHDRVGRTLGRAVYRHDVDSGFPVAVARDAFSRIGLPPEAVLGREDDPNVHAQRAQRIDQMRPAYGSGVIGHDSDPPSLEQRQVAAGLFRSGFDAVLGRRAERGEQKAEQQDDLSVHLAFVLWFRNGRKFGPAS